MKRALALAALVPALAAAHPKGFHKRDVTTVTAKSVEVLVTLDIDSGKRCSLLRTAADADRDGKLSPDELKALKERLAKLAVRPLKVEIAGYPVVFREEESKLDARGDIRASDSALSVAVLAKADLPHAATPGMTLTLADESPDQSHIAVEVFQRSAADAGAEAPVRQELHPGEEVKARLGRLLDILPK